MNDRFIKDKIHKINFLQLKFQLKGCLQAFINDVLQK